MATDTRVIRLLAVLLFVALAGQSVFASAGDTVKTNRPASYFQQKGITMSSVAKVLNLDKGVNGVKFTNPYNPPNVMNVWAGTLNGTIDANTAKFYCIDLAHFLAMWSSSQPHTYTDNGATPAAITYVLNKYYPYKTYPYTGALSTVEKEAASVQLAIWHFADGVDPMTIQDTVLRNRARAIITDANANSGSTVVLSALMVIPGTQTIAVGQQGSLTVQALDAAGAGVPAVAVSVSTTGGTLSTASVTTGTNGVTPAFTLARGSNNQETVTVSAAFTIPQGTKYVHSISPNDYQKLVLATPTVGTRRSTALVNWYQPDSQCDVNGFVTYTQGGWGSPGNSTPGRIRDLNFATVFPSGLTVGSGRTMRFTSATAVENFLPQGGTPSVLTGNLTDPASSPAGVFGGQVVAFAMNYFYDSVGVIGTNPTPLSDLVITSGPLQGKTVRELLQISYTAIGGGSVPYTIPELNSAVTSINENFDNGTSQNGFLGCNTVSADLSLTKTCSNLSPRVGDNITFTITVRNNGASAATGVTVAERLATGFVFVSASASAGSYNAASGIWTVGGLNSGASATLTVTVTVSVQNINNGVFNLGPAADFNVFALEDINQPSADTQGKMAVGRNANLTNYSVGDQLPNSNGTEDVLIVGNNLTFGSGAVYGGNVVFGNNSNLPRLSVSVEEGTVRQGQVIDFTAAGNYLRNLSAQLAGLTVNGTTTFAFNQLVFTGTNAFMNVFTATAAQLSAANYVEINAPNGSVVVVNITGSPVAWMGGLVINGTVMNNVIYNFPSAANISISGIDLRGTVLAPNAHVNFSAGQQNGQMICKSVTGSGQFNHVPFIGNVPVDTTLANIAEVASSAQRDPDSSPGNGAESEDDYGKVLVHVSGATPGSGGGVGGGGNGNWQYLGTFTDGQIIWAFAHDLQRNLLAGTMGGRMYRTTNRGASWNRINDSMNVNYVWSIRVKSNGHIFAGTEKGVWRSTNNGSTWSLVGLSGKDTRALAIDASGSIYAGTWGFGVYKSTDNGASWLPASGNIGAQAVHALAFNPSGSLFAGTFGAGVNRSSDGGTTWSMLNSGYDFVWSLGVTASGKLFAGTYGKGVWRSTDGGASWAQTQNGLVARFIYNVTVDTADNIFVSAWAGGVFASTNGGDNWSSVGMQGYNVSSVISAPGGTAVYAGTSSGQIYVNNSPLTSLRGESGTAPADYELSQNYPNPFNPSTTIAFSMPVKGLVSLKVYNVLGQEVKTLVNDELAPGRYSFSFNASALSSGVYFYKLSSGSVNITRKMVLTK